MYVWASEGLRGDHVSQDAEDVLVGGLLDALVDVPLGVHLTSVLDGQFLAILLSLLFNPLGPLLTELTNFLQPLPAAFGGLLLVIQLQSIIPLILVEIEQHLLFEFIRPVVDIDGVVILVQSLIHGLNGGFVQVAVDGGGLSGFVSRHAHEGVDETEGVDDHLAAD